MSLDDLGFRDGSSTLAEGRHAEGWHPGGCSLFERTPVVPGAASSSTQSRDDPINVPIRRRLVRGNDGGRPFYVADGLALDHAWRDMRASGFAPSRPVTLDFSQMEYLDHDTLLYAGALIRWRVLKKWQTFIELPPEGDVWEFLRAWQFPEFIEQVIGQEFGSVLTEGSRERYERDRYRFPKFVKVIELPGGGVSELLPTEHFQITPIELLDNPFKAATIAREKWLEGHILSILDAYLDDDGERIGSLVILEAVLNAAMHPQAEMAFTSSQIVLPGPDEAPVGKRLQISVWDDGQQLAETLRDRLDAGLGITSPAFGAFRETFHVRLTRSNGREDIRTLRSNRPDLPSEHPWLTVAAFMAGVSSTPERAAADTGDALRQRHEGVRFPGMGLRYIRRNVLNLWRGRIRYWAGSYRFSIVATGEVDTYQVSAYYRPNDAWPLQGNLLILDIPLARDGLESMEDDV